MRLTSTVSPIDSQTQRYSRYRCQSARDMDTSGPKVRQAGPDRKPHDGGRLLSVFSPNWRGGREEGTVGRRIVLVVDDDKNVQEAVRAELAAHNFEVLVAS